MEDSATAKRATQADRPTLNHPEPFTVDTVASTLAKTVLRPEAVLSLPGLLWLYDRAIGRRLFSIAKNGQFPPLLSLVTLRELLLKAYPRLGVFWLLAALRLLNAALERYASNLGEWKADKPRWGREVVIVTGGARGIGAKVVELLSHEKRAKVAVFDLGEPEYAPAPKGAPSIRYYKVRRIRLPSRRLFIAAHADSFFFP